MNLVPINSIQLKTLSPDEIAAIEAAKNIKIKTYGEQQLTDRLYMLLDYLISAFRADIMKWTATEKAVFISDLHGLLTKTYPNLAYEEILEAVKAWIGGKVNKDATYISVVNLCRAINEWQDLVRKEAIAKKNKEEAALSAQISEEEKDKWRQKFREDLLQTFNTYKESKTLPDDEPYLASFYDHLFKNGYALNEEYRIRIYNEAKIEIDSLRTKYISKLKLSDFLITQENAIKVRAKKKALVFIFDWIINNDQNIVI